MAFAAIFQYDVLANRGQPPCKAKGETEIKKKDIGTLITGMVLGASLTGGAAAISVVAEPSNSPIFVNGQQVHMTAYRIEGSNYVRLRDIGRTVGFNVFWDNGIQVDTTSTIYRRASSAGRSGGPAGCIRPRR